MQRGEEKHHIETCIEKHSILHLSLLSHPELPQTLSADYYSLTRNMQPHFAFLPGNIAHSNYLEGSMTTT